MLSVIQHGRYCPGSFSQNFFVYHYQVYPCGAYVFLRSCIYQVELFKIYLTAQNITTHICYQRHTEFIKWRKIPPLRTVYGIVGSNMQVVRGGSYTEISWNGRIIYIFP